MTDGGESKNADKKKNLSLCYFIYRQYRARPASNQTQASAVSLCNNRSSLLALYGRTMLVIQMVYRQISQHSRVAAETRTRDFPYMPETTPFQPNYSMTDDNEP